jgi:hypothetical protein
VVRGTFSPARAWRPAVGARLARTLGLTCPTSVVLMDSLNSPDPFLQFEQEIRDTIARRDLFKIERVLGLRRQLYLDLLDEPSDWSFTVKLAVLLEAALTQVIASRLDTEELQRHLSRLSLGGRTGKLQLAEDLGLLDSLNATRLRSITVIRNTFAHDISIIDKSLNEVVDEMSLNQRGQLVVALLQVPDGKLTLWIAGGTVLAHLAKSFDRNEASRRWLATRLLLSDAFIAKYTGDHETFQEKLKDARTSLDQVKKPRETGAA